MLASSASAKPTGKVIRNDLAPAVPADLSSTPLLEDVKTHWMKV
jgi:hypothetical protein